MCLFLARHIYFSGEHLGVLQGFMEGVVTTGMSAAKMIIKELAPKK